MRKLAVPLLVAGLFAASIGASKAQLTAYASYLIFSSTPTFSNTNNGLGAGKQDTFTTTTSTAITFAFTNNSPLVPVLLANGLPASAIGSALSATITFITPATSTPGGDNATVSATGVSQPYSLGTEFVITYAGPANGALLPGDILLDVKSTVPTLAGSGPSASFNDSDFGGPHHVDVTSKFAPNFESLFPISSYSLTSSNFTPPIGVAGNGLVGTGTGVFNGNFSLEGVPEPGSLAMLFGSGLAGSLFTLRRRRA